MNKFYIVAFSLALFMDMQTQASVPTEENYKQTQQDTYKDLSSYFATEDDVTKALNSIDLALHYDQLEDAAKFLAYAREHEGVIKSPALCARYYDLNNKVIPTYIKPHLETLKKSLVNCDTETAFATIDQLQRCAMIASPQSTFRQELEAACTPYTRSDELWAYDWNNQRILRGIAGAIVFTGSAMMLSGTIESLFNVTLFQSTMFNPNAHSLLGSPEKYFAGSVLTGGALAASPLCDENPEAIHNSRTLAREVLKRFKKK